MWWLLRPENTKQPIRSRPETTHAGLCDLERRQWLNKCKDASSGHDAVWMLQRFDVNQQKHWWALRGSWVFLTGRPDRITVSSISADMNHWVVFFFKAVFLFCPVRLFIICVLQGVIMITGGIITCSLHCRRQGTRKQISALHQDQITARKWVEKPH